MPSSATSCGRSPGTSSRAASPSSSATGRSRGARTWTRPGRRVAGRHRAWTRGSCSARCRTRRSTPRPGSRDGGHHPGTADFNAMYAAWLDDFAARDVESIGFGVVTLQRPRDRPRPLRRPHGGHLAGRVADGPAVLAGPRGAHWLAENGDDAVLDVAWACAPDVHEERHRMPGAVDPNVIVLRQGGGLRRAPHAVHGDRGLRSVCDGELTARAAAGGDRGPARPRRRGGAGGGRGVRARRGQGRAAALTPRLVSECSLI